MSNVGVVGLGNWGTALACHLARLGHAVIGWSRNEEVVQSINGDRRNPRYQSDILLHESLSATADLERLQGCEALVLAVPSHALHEVCGFLSFASYQVVVSGIKGFHRDTLKTPTHYLSEQCGTEVPVVALGGPSFARDVLLRHPCGVVIAGARQEWVERGAALFSGEALRVYSSLDPLGVELGGAVKNVIALAVGIADGLGLGDSTRAVLITRGLAEMTRLVVAAGGLDQTLGGLAGLGDLVMTATCNQSRNRTVGVRLGAGEELSAILSTLGSVAEGVPSTELVLKLAALYGVEMPISHQVQAVLRGECTPATAVERLLRRPRRMEFE